MQFTYNLVKGFTFSQNLGNIEDIIFNSRSRVTILEEGPFLPHHLIHNHYLYKYYIFCESYYYCLDSSKYKTCPPTNVKVPYLILSALTICKQIKLKGYTMTKVQYNKQLQAARAFYAKHDGKITRDTDQYAAYKQVCTNIREYNNFSKHSWKQVNDLIAGNTADETSVDDFMKEYS